MNQRFADLKRLIKSWNIDMQPYLQLHVPQAVIVSLRFSLILILTVWMLSSNWNIQASLSFKQKLPVSNKDALTRLRGVNYFKFISSMSVLKWLVTRLRKETLSPSVSYDKQRSLQFLKYLNQQLSPDQISFSKKCCFLSCFLTSGEFYIMKQNT